MRDASPELAVRYAVGPELHRVAERDLIERIAQRQRDLGDRRAIIVELPGARIARMVLEDLGEISGRGARMPELELAKRFVEIFSKLARAGDPVTVTEMLPTFDQLWLVDAQGDRYCGELRMVMLDDEAWSP